MVNKRELEYNDLELRGPYTRKGMGIRIQDLEELIMVMERAKELNYQFGEEET